jgi:hypothetical protein
LVGVGDCGIDLAGNFQGIIPYSHIFVSSVLHILFSIYFFVNGPLQSFNRITKNVEEISEKVTSATSGLLDKSGPALKVAGALVSAAQLSKGRAKKKKKKAE